MAFDASQTLKDMALAAQSVFAQDWPKVKSCAEEALLEQQETLAEIAAARIAGDLTQEEMDSQIEDEQKAFETMLLACEVKAKATAQNAANAAFKVLEKAILAAL